MTEMDSLCECFDLTQIQLGKIMKMPQVQLSLWQTGQKKPNIINVFRLMIFLLRHYNRYSHRELITKEYRWEKTKPQTNSQVTLQPQSDMKATEKSKMTSKMASPLSRETTAKNIAPQPKVFESKLFQTDTDVKKDRTIGITDKVE
ncbi:hypothetical protein [uncultured Shewanella sp.]|uniref:hypothetical protein n=1 Tax=uncultured Shewanella sp. TaxID=173975 RepID=UPI0026182346|nr:hypothetical protein [uncultured Shewanella sp.]